MMKVTSTAHAAAMAGKLGFGGHLSGWIGAAGLVVSLWAPEIVAQEYPEAPVVVDEDVDAGLSEIAKTLKENGVKGLESVVVVSTDGVSTTFANAKSAAAAVHFSIDAALLPVPWSDHDTDNPNWKTNWDHFSMQYVGSPGTVLVCNSPLNGRRNCTQN
jgi:hypothetical protein